jgi:hypothetical protein
MTLALGIAGFSHVQVLDHVLLAAMDPASHGEHAESEQNSVRLPTEFGLLGPVFVS